MYISFVDKLSFVSTQLQVKYGITINQSIEIPPCEYDVKLNISCTRITVNMMYTYSVKWGHYD